MPNMAIWCCCGGVCPNDWPPLEVTISWSSAPTGNSGWEATATGKLDMFGKTFSNGQTHDICPTSYFFRSINGGTAVDAVWKRQAISGNLGFSNYYASQGLPQYDVNLGEKVQTRDGARRYARVLEVRNTGGGGTNTITYNYSTNISATSGLSLLSLQAALVKTITFDEFAGQITTSAGITIAWAKSAEFPAGSPT